MKSYSYLQVIYISSEQMRNRITLWGSSGDVMIEKLDCELEVSTSYAITFTFRLILPGKEWNPPLFLQLWVK